VTTGFVSGRIIRLLAEATLVRKLLGGRAASGSGRRPLDEKQVDVAIATQIVEDSFQYMRQGDRVVLVSGDRDYLPVIESLAMCDIPTIVTFWQHAKGRELKQPPADFFALDPLFDHLAR
jgi:uncharacterized LabA/DUF88 family protein